jgi:hypothetical protein
VTKATDAQTRGAYALQEMTVARGLFASGQAARNDILVYIAAA